MKIYFYTQDYENYGSPDEPYWKPKGGSDFILEADSWTEEMIDSAYSVIEHEGEMFIRSMIGHLEICDEFKTDLEQFQLENDGEILFPATRLTYDNFMKLNGKMKESV